MVPEPFLLRVVDKNTLQSIHEQSVQLLARAGVIFDNETILNRFVRKGQKVDGNRVYLSEALVAEALEAAPKSFTMAGRNGVAGVRIGGNQETTVVAPGNGTLFIQDIEGRRRRATLSDFDHIVKLCENSRNVNLVGAIPVEPSDLPELFKPARLVHHLMRHSNKPLIGAAEKAAGFVDEEDDPRIAVQIAGAGLLAGLVWWQRRPSDLPAAAVVGRRDRRAIIDAIGERRGPAPEAQALYTDLDPPVPGNDPAQTGDRQTPLPAVDQLGVDDPELGVDDDRRLDSVVVVVRRQPVGEEPQRLRDLRCGEPDALLLDHRPDEVAAELDRYAWFKVDQTRPDETAWELAETYRVVGVPTVIVYRGGSEAFRITGFEPPERFLERLQQVGS